MSTDRSRQRPWRHVLGTLALLALLSAPTTALAQQPDLEPLARGYLLDNAKALNLERADLQNLLLLDQHRSNPTGVHHLYFQQHVNGVPLKNAVVSVAIRNAAVVYAASRATPRLETRAPELTPLLVLRHASIDG